MMHTHFPTAPMLRIASPKRRDQCALSSGWCLLQFFFLGTFARDGVLLVATGWPSPMRLFTFVQCFGVAFYMTDKMVGMPYKLTTKI